MGFRSKKKLHFNTSKSKVGTTEVTVWSTQKTGYVFFYCTINLKPVTVTTKKIRGFFVIYPYFTLISFLENCAVFFLRGEREGERRRGAIKF